MRVFKIYLYNLWTKKRNLFVYFAHISFSFSKTFLNSNEKFLMMFENNVMLLIWYFAEIRAFKFFTTRSSNIIYRKFFSFSSNLFSRIFLCLFSLISYQYLLYFFLFFFFLFIYCSVAVLNNEIILIIRFFVFVKRFRKKRIFRWNYFIIDWVW